MGQAKIPYGVVLGIERILLEYSDREHPLSIADIKKYLSEIYGFQVSDDALRNRVIPEMREFCLLEQLSEKEAVGLQAGWEIPQQSLGTSKGAKDSGSRNSGPSRRKAKIWVENRLFSDFEVDYIADTVATSIFLGEGKSTDLIKRIQSMQSRHNREDRALRRSADAKSAKPDLNRVAYTMETLNEAIEKQRTVSFDYLRYSSTDAGIMNAHELRPVLRKANRPGGDHFDNLSPYRLQFMDEHYFLLANARNKSETRDAFKVFRLDLMANIECSDDSALYKRVVNENAPADYFRGAVAGMGGKRKAITLRCHPSAYHYVVERFSEFEGFTTTKPKNGQDGWLYVKFMAVPDGVVYWVQKFLRTIELLEPKSARNRIIANLQENAYGQFEQLDVRRIG